MVYSTTAAAQLRVRLDAVREKEHVQQAMVFLVSLALMVGIVYAYCFTILKQYAGEPDTLQGFFAFAGLVMFVALAPLVFPMIGMRIARRLTVRAAKEYEALAELLRVEPYRTLAEDIRTGRYRFPNGYGDDIELSLEYSSIITRL